VPRSRRSACAVVNQRRRDPRYSESPPAGVASYWAVSATEQKQLRIVGIRVVVYFVVRTVASAVLRIAPVAIIQAGTFLDPAALRDD